MLGLRSGISRAADCLALSHGEHKLATAPSSVRRWPVPKRLVNVVGPGDVHLLIANLVDLQPEAVDESLERVAHESANPVRAGTCAGALKLDVVPVPRARL